MFKLNYICILVVLAVGDASQNGLFIAEPLPLGHAFGGLGWNNALPTVLPRNNGWGWANPSYSYSYVTGHGWPSTPIYKEVPIAYNPGWGQQVPITYNPGWGKVPVTYNGWNAPVINNGWNAPVINSGWNAPVVAPVINNGWNAPAVVPAPLYGKGNGWGQQYPVYGNGWGQQYPVYGNGWGQQYPVYGNGWGQTAVQVLGIKNVPLAQGIPLINLAAGNGWAASRYAGGWGTPNALYK